MNKAISIALFPFSWKIGVWRRNHKDIWSLGPFRFTYHRDPGEWKQ